MRSLTRIVLGLVFTAAAVAGVSVPVATAEEPEVSFSTTEVTAGGSVGVTATNLPSAAGAFMMMCALGDGPGFDIKCSIEDGTVIAPFTGSFDGSITMPTAFTVNDVDYDCTTGLGCYVVLAVFDENFQGVYGAGEWVLVTDLVVDVVVDTGTTTTDATLAVTIDADSTDTYVLLCFLDIPFGELTANELINAVLFGCNFFSPAAVVQPPIDEVYPITESQRSQCFLPSSDCFVVALRLNGGGTASAWSAVPVAFGEEPAPLTLTVSPEGVLSGAGQQIDIEVTGVRADASVGVSLCPSNTDLTDPLTYLLSCDTVFIAPTRPFTQTYEASSESHPSCLTGGCSLYAYQTTSFTPASWIERPLEFDASV